MHSRVQSFATPTHTGETAALTRVLLVEDNEPDAALVADYFDAPRVSDGGAQVVCVARLARALELLRTERFDVLLLDLSLPDASGLDGLARIRDAAPDVPVVVMTGLSDDRLALAAVQAGAQDYLVKGQDGPRVVRRAARYAIERHRLRREREATLAREHEAREAAERSARKRDEVLGIVSHDLRTPLSTIIMAARALESTDDVAALADIITRSGTWALRIISDLLDVTAIEAGRLRVEREPMLASAIVDAVESAFALQAREAGVRLVVDRGDGPRWLDADVDRVVQAIGNLVSNAIKFTPRGGRVSLGVRADAHEVRFRVQDTGPGIPAEHLPRLFDRFWQAREARRGGAGLGLAIARGIAEGHGGRVEVESEPGRGSAFTLVLPAAGGASRQASRGTSAR